MLQIKKLLKISLPISANLLSSSITNFVAVLFIAKLGQNELAAGALAMSTYFTLIMIVQIFNAVGILISHAVGKNESPTAIGIIFKNSFLIASLFAIPMGILIWHADYLLVLFHQDPAIIQLTKTYFHYGALALLPFLLSGVISQFYFGINRPKSNLLETIITLPINVALMYCLILGKLNLAGYHLAGITIAMLMVQTGSCVVRLFRIYFNSDMTKYNIFAYSNFINVAICKRILSFGLPIGAQTFAEVGSFTLLNYFMGFFGIIALAASQIVSQYSFIMIMIYLGLSRALALLNSKAFARNDFELIKKYQRSALLLLILLFIVLSPFYIIWPNALINFFITDNISNPLTVIYWAKILMIFSFLTLFIDGVRNIYTGSLRGLQDTSTAMYAGIVCQWLISMPLSYLLAFHFQEGPIGLRIGFLGGFIISMIVVRIRVNQKLCLYSQQQVLSS